MPRIDFLGGLKKIWMERVFSDQKVAVDWADVHQIGERLALQYTVKSGHRSFDILHIATALHLGAVEFLSFDANQKKLIKVEG